MSKQTRHKFSADFKAKAAMEAIKNQKTASDTNLHGWQRQGNRQHLDRALLEIPEV